MVINNGFGDYFKERCGHKKPSLSLYSQRLIIDNTLHSYELHCIVIRRVYLLVDSRHGMKTSDMEMMKLLDECALPYQVCSFIAILIGYSEVAIYFTLSSKISHEIFSYVLSYQSFIL